MTMPFDACLAALRQPGPPEALFKAVDKALAETVGHKLFTLLYVAPDGKRVKRLYTNMPKEYPVGGYEPVTESDWHKLVIGQRRSWSASPMRTSNGRSSIMNSSARWAAIRPSTCRWFMQAACSGP